MNWIKKHKVISGVLGVFIVLVVLGSIGSSSTPSKSGNTKTETTTDSKSSSQTQENTAPKQWVTVVGESGTSAKRTDVFTLKGGKTKLTYTFNGGQSIVGAIYVVAEGHSIQKEGGFPEVTVTKSGTDSTFLVKDAGNYYLDISSANADWTIKIEEER